MENFIEKLFICFIIVSVLVVFVGLPLALYMDTKIIEKYKNGEISLEEYCDISTNYGTNTSIPPVCYSIYNLKQTGTERVCSYNVALKMPTCKTVPLLEYN